MVQANYPYLDLTVLPEIRPYVVASNAVLLFDTQLQSVFWTNGEGARLIGSDAVRSVLDGDATPNATMMRQIAMAVEKLADEQEAAAMVRIRTGFKSRLLGFSVRKITLPKGEEAVLLITESLHGRGHSLQAMARIAVDCLDGYSHASAILDADGAIFASSERFSSLEVTDEQLAQLTEEVATESDRLVKRLINTSSGSMAAGIARLGDSTPNHILIIADPHEADETSTPAASAKPADAAVVAGSDESTAQDDAPQENTDAPPRVGAFSNKRSSGMGGGLARWYFKQPASPAAETSSDADTEDPVSVAPVESQDKTTELASPTADQSEENPDEIAETKGDDEGSILVQETDFVPTQHPLSQDENDDLSTTPDQQDGTEEQSDLGDFEFEAGSKPIRFVWEMDAKNEFRTVSDEFAVAVGPKAASVEGLTWQELCEFHQLDNGDDITALLEKGDTWSGKTVLWPIEGTDLRVPIDLAGLPSYGRNRTFEGFNGFGIVRTADAVVDPLASGLSLFEDSAGGGFADIHDVEPLVEKDQQTSINESLEEIGDGVDKKVVDLDTRRESRSDRSLSSDEQETFEEIGEKLSDDSADAAQENDSTDNKDTDAESQGDAADFVPSAFAGPGRKKASSEDQGDPGDGAPKQVSTPDHNVDTSILARLPIPVLVYRNDELLFANDNFFETTGYSDLSSLAQAGGIDALFGGSTERPSDGDEFAQIFHASGEQLDVTANLQCVPWDENRAMLLTLRHGQDDGHDMPPSDHQDEIDSNGDNVESDNDAEATGDDRSESGASDADRPRSHLSMVGGTANEPESDSGADNSGANRAFGGLGAEDLRSILDTATDGVIILSDEGIIRALNRSAEALFDVDPDNVRDHSFTRLLAPESHRSALDYLSGMSGTGVASLMNDGREVIGKTSKGGLIPLFMTIGKLENTDACCVVMRDITEWKKAEEELLSAKAMAESASAQKTEFLAKVSHEIRTPLNAIIGFSDMMIEERFGGINNDRYRGYLRDIHRSGNHVLELVNDLLDISKIEAGKMDLEFDACDLNTTVSETVALTQPDANKERVIIRTSLSAVVPKVVADPRSLRQIILNLVSNSIKYTKTGGPGDRLHGLRRKRRSRSAGSRYRCRHE